MQITETLFAGFKGIIQQSNRQLCCRGMKDQSCYIWIVSKDYTKDTASIWGGSTDFIQLHWNNVKVIVFIIGRCRARDNM